MGVEIAWGIAAAVVGLWIGLGCRLDGIGDGGGRSLKWAAGAMVWMTVVVGLAVAFWAVVEGGGGSATVTIQEDLGQALMVGLLGAGVAPMAVGGWLRRWGAEGATSAHILGVMRWSGPLWVVAIGAAVTALSWGGDEWWSAAGWRWGVSVVLGVGLGAALALLFRWVQKWREMALVLGVIVGVIVAEFWGAQTVLVFLVAGVWLGHATERGKAVGEALGRFVGVVTLGYVLVVVWMGVEWPAVLAHWEGGVALVGGRAVALVLMWLWWRRREIGREGFVVGALVAQDLVVLVMAGSLRMDGGLAEAAYGAVVMATLIHLVVGLGTLYWSMKRSGEDRGFELRWQQRSEPSQWRDEGMEDVLRWEQEQGLEGRVSELIKFHIQGHKRGGDGAPRDRHGVLGGLGSGDEEASRVGSLWEGVWRDQREEDVRGLIDDLMGLEVEAVRWEEDKVRGLAMRLLRHLEWALEEREAICHQLWEIGRRGGEVEEGEWEALEERREGFEEGWRRGVVEAVAEALESDEGWTAAQGRRGRELLAERFEAHRWEAERIGEGLRLDWEIDRWRRWGEQFLEEVSGELRRMLRGGWESEQRLLDRRWWGGWWLEEMEKRLASTPEVLVVYRRLPADWRGEPREVWRLELRRWLELRLRRELALTMVELRDRLVEQVEQVEDEGFKAGFEGEWLGRLERHLEVSLAPLERRDIEEVSNRLDRVGQKKNGEAWTEVVVAPLRTVGRLIGRRWAHGVEQREGEDLWREAVQGRARGGDEGYLRHFSTAPVEIADHYVERGLEGELSREVEGMLDEKSGPLLVSGDPGVGRRSLVRHVAEGVRQQGGEVVWFKAVRSAEKYLMKGRGEELRITVEEAMASSGGERNALVVVEGIERWLWRRPGELTAMEKILAEVEEGLMGGWIWVMEENARRWLAAALEVDQYVRQTITVGPWSRDGLEALIMARHQGSGRGLVFEQRPRGLGERMQQWWQGSRGRWGKKDYFDRLHRLSRGRADAALRWWKASLRGEEAKRPLVVRSLRDSREVGLRDREEEEMLILATLGLHGALEVGELEELIGEEQRRCGRWIRRLEEQGLVDGEPEEGDRYRLAVMARGRIEEDLRSKGWL